MYIEYPATCQKISAPVEAIFYAKWPKTAPQMFLWT